MEGNKLSVKQVIQAPQRPLVSRAVCLVACLPLVAACQRDLTDLEQFRDEVLSRGAGVIEPIPPLSSRSGTITPRIFGRDVFAELDVDGGVADEPPEFLGCPPGSRPAASVQISKLGYLSTIATSSTRQALLVDADGTLYRIAVGDRVGLGCLSVASIEPEGIMLQMRNGERLRLERKKRQD